jgi:hypothetical protein
MSKQEFCESNMVLVTEEKYMSETLSSQLEPRRREAEPFTKRTIRLFATNKSGVEDNRHRPYGRRQVKTRSNYLDTVRGCPFASPTFEDRCPWDCYAQEAVKRYKIMFEVPVSQKFNYKKLAEDIKKCSKDWIRIGVFGEPSYNWPLTSQVARLVSDMGKIPVIVTRLWKPPEHPQVLKNLREAQPLIHLTVCALDRDSFLGDRLKFALNPPAGVTVALRLVTFAFREGCLLKRQEMLADWGGLVLEQPARIFTTNPIWKLLDQSRMHKGFSYLSRTEAGRWYTAGKLLGKPCCEDLCVDCKVACLTSLTKRRPRPQGLQMYQTCL